ncbi:MAG: PIG-L family deacetylase [Clostridiales bacterium]|nr:PIG-L family deacetylase [Clostridiales bacterium]
MNANNPRTDASAVPDPNLSGSAVAAGRRPPLRKWMRIAALLLSVLILAGGFLWYAMVHSGYAAVENSVFASAFYRNRRVLVLVPHEDDEVNLAYGVIDSFVRAGSDVTVAFLTNGEARIDPAVRNREAVRTAATLGVPADHLVFLGYGDHISDPPLYRGAPDDVRAGEAGQTQTFAAGRFTDYHTARFGKPAAVTLANVREDLRALILERRPDVLFVTDLDDHVDHVSLSRIFDSVLGDLLRGHGDYRPQVFKGFAYEYAWHGNDDFYRIPLLSAAPGWMPASYNACYRWEERVRFVTPGDYLSYTLRGSRLYTVLRCYDSQNAFAKESRLLNGDKVFWERRADNLALTAAVWASSGDATLLADFVLEGTAEDPLEGCWFPDTADARATVTFSWPSPQDIRELVFYDAPAPAGDVRAVRVRVNGGAPVEFALTDGGGLPCRMALGAEQARTLSVEIIPAGNGPCGLFEIEALPARELSPRWIKLTDANGDFCYELPCPAGQPLRLGLYGYPAAPQQATATLFRDGQAVASPVYEGGGFTLPPLAAGRYRLRVTDGACVDEAVLRVGDAMLWQRGLQWLERQIRKALPKL